MTVAIAIVPILLQLLLLLLLLDQSNTHHSIYQLRR
jgi:hypothetical protein